MAATKAIPIPQLQAWRSRQFLSQFELAQLAGVVTSTISLAESGGRVRFSTARKLAAALGIEPEQLCAEAVEPAAVAS